jgi:hypothetical protein
MSSLRRAVGPVGGALLAASLITGCASSTGSASASSSTGPTSAPTSSNRAGNGPGGAQFAAVRSCLQAAGIPVPTPTGPRPGFTRTPGQPRPSGSRAGFRGQGGRFLADPKVQAALKACGITLPSPGTFRRPSGPASTSPTS